jgi:hypothetical protein
MDCPLPVVSDDGDLPWSDSNSMDSDDGHSVGLNNSPPWMDHLPTSVSESISSTAHTGQLSPISNGMDTATATCLSGQSSAPTLIHSASSSCTDSWSIDYLESDEIIGIGSGADADMDGDIHWEGDSDDMLTVTKLEPVDDDDFRLDDVKEAPTSSSSTGTDEATTTQPKAKRPRGRPRKHPLTPIVTTNKVTKGRSKTGCLTCRKRKKKCDEAKPRCKSR